MERLLHCLLQWYSFFFGKAFSSSNRKALVSRFFVLGVLLALGNISLVSSQSFPVQVIPQAIPPSPIYFSSYADASTSSSPLRVQVVLNDFTITNREVRLKAYFQGNGISFQSNDIVFGAPTLFLEGGIPLTLTNVELAPYFRFENITGISPNVYGRAIPEGAYQFCFEIIDVLSGNRLSQKSCATTIIFQNEPPFLVSPYNKTNIEERNPQNIVFQWTPRQLNVSNVEYELSIVEIWDTYVDPQAAFLSSPPIFQTTTSATTYVYGPSDPLFLSNKNYAWRVQAKAKQGTEEIGLFKNQGYSEIYSFSYAGVCSLPISINHEVKGITNANIFWDDFSTDVPEYTVRYRKKGNENAWFFNKTTSNTTTLWDLKAGTVYEYQVQKKCVVTQSDWSIVKQFTTFIADDEASVYECGITPDFSLTNKEPLPSITVGEEFTAGDFAIKILEVSGSNGKFTGKGYVTIPYLNSIRVGVEFTNILINTDKQMAEGTVITMYDPSLGNIVDVDAAIDTVTEAYDAVADLGDTVENILEDVFNRKSKANESNEEDTTEETDDEQSSSTDSESQNETNSNSEATQSPGESTSNSNSDQVGDTSNNTINSSFSPENKETVIFYNGSSYKHGDVIEINYKRDLERQQFKLVNISEDAKVVWSTHANMDDIVAASSAGDGFQTDLDLREREYLALESEYWSSGNSNSNETSKKIRIGIKVLRKEFDLIELYAKHKEKRIAKSGQKLYLLDDTGLTESSKHKEVEFGIKISPDLNKNEINNLNLEWYYGPDNHLPKDRSKLNIFRNIKLSESEVKTTVRAGYPIANERGIDVVWFKRDYMKYKFSLGTSSNSFLKNAMKLTEESAKLSKYIEKLPFIEKIEKGDLTTGVGFYFDILPWQQKVENYEDLNSRLFYTQKSTTGGLDVGISGTAKWTVWGLPYEKLPLPDYILEAAKKFLIMEVYVVAKAQAGGELKAELVERKMIEEEKWKEESKKIDPALLKLNIELGAGAEISLLKSNDYFSISGEAKGIAKAELISFGWQKGKDLDVYFLREGVWMDVSANAYVKFLGKKLQSEPFYKKIQIIEKPILE